MTEGTYPSRGVSHCAGARVRGLAGTLCCVLGRDIGMGTGIVGEP